MKKNTTVYEDQEEKKRQYAEKHIVQCPHCGEGVLDRVTTCPHCGGELKPVGYQPLTDKQMKKIKTITYIVGSVIAVAVLLVYFLVIKPNR